ncbi:hypothetical protein ACNKHM_20110 [Shigella sonnei]
MKRAIQQQIENPLA